MEDIYLSRRELKKLEPLSDKSHGVFGQCYRYNNGVLKIYYNNVPFYLRSSINKNIKRDSKIILYPKCKLYKKGIIFPTLKGYYMDEAPGINLLTLSNNIISGKQDLSFDEILSLYYDSFIPELKTEKILMSDLKLPHIFVDDNFYFTDTDSYEDGFSNSFMYRENLKQINFVFFDFFINVGSLPIKAYSSSFSKENYFYRQVNEIRKLTGNSVNTLREFCEYRKR